LKCFICLFFLYVASVASRCFKSRSAVAHGMRVGSGRGCEQSPRATFSGVGLGVGAGDAGTIERSLSDAGPHVDTKSREETDCNRERPNASVRPDVRELAVPIILSSAAINLHHRLLSLF
jgi:hypothetical protein